MFVNQIDRYLCNHRLPLVEAALRRV